MKRALSTFFITLFFVTISPAVQIGDLPTAVTSTMGEPVAVRTKPSGQQVWKMKDGTTVWITRGSVSQIAQPEEGRSIKVGGVAADETNAPANLSEAEKAVMTDVVHIQPQIGRLLLFVGLVVIAVTKFQYCQCVFKAPGWQLFGCLIPFVSFAFVFSHWRQTKKLFAWQMVVALPLFLAGFHLVPTSSAPDRTGPSRAASMHSPVQPRAAAR